MKTDNTKFNILTLASETRTEATDLMEKEMSKYFEINHLIDNPSNIKNYLDASIDILFIWAGEKNTFKNAYYTKFKAANNSFKYVVIKKTMEESDYKLYKNLVDDIVYYEQDDNAKWKILAILRRYWDTFSKKTTIIHKGIIADLVDNQLIVDSNEVELTSIEWKLFKYLIERRNKFVPKNEIFEHIWGYKGDTTRTLDQMLFKLKRKLGAEYFETSRKEGVKFE